MIVDRSALHSSTNTLSGFDNRSGELWCKCCNEARKKIDLNWSASRGWLPGEQKDGAAHLKSHPTPARMHGTLDHPLSSSSLRYTCSMAILILMAGSDKAHPQTTKSE